MRDQNDYKLWLFSSMNLSKKPTLCPLNPDLNDRK